MNGGFGMRKDRKHVSNLPKCSLCYRIFLTPRDLIIHFNTRHSNHHFSTFSSSAVAAPTTIRHYPYPNPALSRRNRFDMNYYRSGYIDEQGRCLKGFPVNTPANNSNILFGQQKKPKLMNLFPAISPECIRTLPLLCRLEQRRPQETVAEEDWAISSPIDLTLKL